MTPEERQKLAEEIAAVTPCTVEETKRLLQRFKDNAQVVRVYIDACLLQGTTP